MSHKLVKDNDVPRTSSLVHVMISNIPVFYHSSTLRNYFSQFLESDGFDCFHFRHRPEVVRTLPRLVCNNEEQSNGVDKLLDKAVVINGSNSIDEKLCSSDEGKKRKTKNSTTCCIVRLREERFNEFMRMYCGRRWLDEKGEPTSAVCRLSKIKINQFSNKDDKSNKFPTRAEYCQIPSERETFTASDLTTLLELNPPPLMPHGNVGTPTNTFLKLIQECKLPPSIITKLGLTFPRTRSNRRYGNVALDYEAQFINCRNNYLNGQSENTAEVTLVSNPAQADVTSDLGTSVGLDLEKTSEKFKTKENASITNAAENEQLFPETGDEIRINTGIKLTDDNNLRSVIQNAPKRSCAQIKSTGNGLNNAKQALNKRKKKRRNEEDKREESDSDDCEEWDRYTALHDDPTNQERNTERLFESEMEVVWEKGGSGLVWYTDAQFWDQQDGDEEEKDTDDWDLDFGPYYDSTTGDKDSRDFVQMKRDERRRQGRDCADEEMYDSKIGQFEKYSKGIGRKVMTRQGWAEGKGLGSTIQGMADALDGEGQKPWDKKGLGYRGVSKLVQLNSIRMPSSEPTPKRRRIVDPDQPIISTIYDDPTITDPPEGLLRRREPYHLKYRPGGGVGIAFIKSNEILKPR